MMTFERWNTLARTLMLGIVVFALLVLVFQAGGVLTSAKDDTNAVSVQAVDLLKTAQGFIPKQSIDVAKFYAVAASAVALLDTTKSKVSATQPAIDATASFVQKLGVSADRLNVPCPANDNDKLHPCGTLADVAKTLNSGRHTLVEVETGVHKFDEHEDALFAQEQETWARTNVVLDNANAFLRNPNFQTILGHVATSSGTVDHMLFTADKVETKVTKCTLEPTFACQFKGWLLPAAQIFGALATK
jgi:hypothetical protein